MTEIILVTGIVMGLVLRPLVDDVIKTGVEMLTPKPKKKRGRPKKDKA